MLNERAYSNSVPGTWGTFETERPRLNLQQVNPKFSDRTGLSPEDLKTGFCILRDELSGASPVIRKARLFAYLVLNGRIAVDPDDWFADALDHQNLLRDYNSAAMKNIPALHIPETRAALRTAGATGYYETGLDVGHVSPGWRYMFDRGLSGILEEAQRARAAHGGELTPEQRDFYDALEIVYRAIMGFSLRLAEEAEFLLETRGAAADARLRTMASALRNVPVRVPGDFHEALQFALIMHNMVELEGEWVRSMGGFDRNFFRYYDADIKAKRLTPDRAKELIKFFFTKFYANTRGAGNGKNFYFGGQDRDGAMAENELTYLALETYHEMNTTDPKLSLRFFAGSSERLYRQAAESIRAGRTGMVLINDEIAVPAILSRGKTMEEAREYLLIGCYEPAIEGKEVACNMSIPLNLAKGIELVLNRGMDINTGTQLGPDTGDPLAFTSYEAFEAAFFTQLHAQIDAATASVRQYELFWPLMNPSPVLGGTFSDGVERGRDIGQCGPKYNNTGCMGAGLGTAVDSLCAIRAVFDEGICTTEEMLNAIKNDFIGHDSLRMYLQYKIPRWGNGDPAADDIAKRVTDDYCAYVNAIPNSRGGKFVPSMFSLAHRYSLGKHTAATPCGRKNAEPLSLNNAASPGKDTRGVTALLRSLTCINYRNMPNGSVTDVYLHPSALKGEAGLAALISLIKTYFARGGYGLQFNIFDRETLLDAQKHPEKYQTLQIRVCGWNVYFVTMSPFEQEQYINMNIHEAS